jgi:hypothetical protein
VAARENDVAVRCRPPYCARARRASPFRSWFLLFGVVPIDRRTMEFELLEEGRFVESSTSWLNGRARHERTAIAGVGGSTVLTDRLVIESRGRLVDALIRASVTQTFRRRHRRLRRHFQRQIARLMEALQPVPEVPSEGGIRECGRGRGA